MSTSAARALAGRKVRRQKQIVAIGSVILLALLGYQLPKLLGGGSESTAPAPVLTGPSQSGSPLAAAPGKLPDTDRPGIQPGPGQLLSFGLFKSKDPFVQQLSASGSASSTEPAPSPATTTTPTPTTTSSSGSTEPSPSTTPVIPPPTTPTTTSATTTSSTTTPGAPAPAPTSVAIATNGLCEVVALQGTFPASEGIFRVVWIARNGKSVRIAVVGGAYDSGQATATITMGETLTLVNTADGTRYVLALKSKCDAGTQPVTPTPTPTPTPTTSTSATTTIAPPTTTATTPIVTDSLDTTTPSG